MTVDELTTEQHDPEPEPVEPRWSPRAKWAAALVALVLVGLVTAGLLVKLPYYTLSPGSVRATEPLISVQGADTYEADGGVDYLTVSLRQATPVEMLAAWINPAVDVVPREEVLGDQTPQENREVNLQMMSDSKDSATYQALHRLGYDIPVSGSGAAVAAVADGGPSDGLLERGEVIVGADGEPIALSSDLVEAVRSRAPGDVMDLEVTTLEPSDERRTVQVSLGAREDDPTQGLLGVSTVTRGLTFDFPVDVTIDSGSVGGPSAGLAFTLGLLDRLTPGSITGGLDVATTGTMALDGTVGPVGGVPQKVEAAKREGVDLMLVPADELDQALARADGLRIEPADTLDDALAVLATVGGGDAVLPPEPVAAEVG